MSRPKQPSLHYSGYGRPSLPSLFKTTSSSPNPIVEAAIRRFMTPDARPIFQRHWEQAKARLGPWKAGLTLRSFIEFNTKEIELDPWAEAARDNMMRPRTFLRSTGSTNPLTYDCVLVLCKLASTTLSPTLLHVESNTLISVGDDVVFFRKGKWFYAAGCPLPGRGKVLEDWEYIKCWTARFTLPFMEPDEGSECSDEHAAVEIDMQIEHTV
ncbi:hypothetical protein BDY19DRAFT_265923 [Irpex rosettiformis]|uniref:Uncharacterized protein n=1 Tax=Irpex rosettiformis TaxID=378272 RepID=A0ACB8UH25_9APHY|nr:hypothetical protein BDY19DRAFT_265923 [Irpex rosettiformis]